MKIERYSKHTHSLTYTDTGLHTHPATHSHRRDGHVTEIAPHKDHPGHPETIQRRQPVAAVELPAKVCASD